MFVSRFVAILLFVASVLVHFVLAGQIREFPHWTSLVYCGYSFGQLTILGAWLGCGRGLLMLRVSTVLAVSALSASTMSLVSRPGFEQFFWFYWIVSCLVAVPLSILRLRGFVIAPFDVPETKNGSLRRWQFSLQGLLAWMTVTAMILGATSWMEWPAGHVWQGMGYAVAVTIAGHAALWSVFGRVFGRVCGRVCGRANLPTRLLGAIMAQLAVVVCLASAVEDGQRHREAWPIAAICLVAFITATVTCLALSGGGFTFARHVPARVD